MAASQQIVRALDHASTVIRLTAFDETLSYAAVSVGFAYETSVSEADLIRGLQVALAHYPVFGGRMRCRPDSAELVCDNQGISLSVRVVDATVDDATEWLTDNAIDRIVTPVNARRARAGKEPLLSLRITYLAGGGMLVGASWHHSIGDTQSFMRFMDAWSAAVDGRDIASGERITNRSAYLLRHFTERNLVNGKASSLRFRRLRLLEVAKILVALRKRNFRSVTLYFTSDEISEMKRALGSRLSANDVVSAHIHDLVRRCEGAESPRELMVVVNFRKRLGLGPDVLGNLLTPMMLPWKPGDSVGEMSGRIRAGVDHYLTDHFDYPATEREIDAIPRRARWRYVPIDPTRRILTFTNWSKFGVYDVSFGGSRPMMFAPLSARPQPWASVLVEGFRGEGVLVRGDFPVNIAAELHKMPIERRHPYRRPGTALSTPSRTFL
ncbi:hypothetical protein LVJ94_49005 [Pendulispora rubella]|uniref:Uncharacterized protein n=1 Tax=Pendulispora rubella TaxID=2741070 RepID=A0ABZ2L1L1_9BACT